MTTTTNGTEATLAHHLQAVTQGVDAIMSDYTEESVLFTPEGPLKGVAEIRQFFTAFVTSAPPGLIEALAVIRQDVEGEIAYLLWQAPPFIPLATDTFIIQNGKIIVQSFATLASAATP